MPGAAEHRAVGALQPPVEAADDLPLQAAQQRGRARRSSGQSVSGLQARPSGTGSAGQHPASSRSSAVTSSDSASYDSTRRWRSTSRARSATSWRQRVVPAADEGQRPGGEDQVDRRARAGAEADVAGQVAQADRRPGRGWRRPAAPRTRSAPGRRTPASTCALHRDELLGVDDAWLRGSAAAIARSTITNSSVGVG